jgi:hypothetical protein
MLPLAILISLVSRRAVGQSHIAGWTKNGPWRKCSFTPRTGPQLR